MENKTNSQTTTEPRHCRVFDVGDSAFLDDNLYYYTVNNPPQSAPEFQELLNDLYAICQQQYISKIDPGNFPLKKEMKAHFDRAFNSWDAFVKKLNKDKHPLADMFSKYSFKYILLSNPEMKELYDVCS